MKLSGAVVILTSTPRAPLKLTSSNSGLEIACSTATRARSLPLDSPIPIIAMPVMLIMFFTSAKSKLIKPGDVMISEIPATPLRNTLLAARNAARTVTPLPNALSSLSFGTTISESTCCFSKSMPCWATCVRLPSCLNGRVTTATVKIPISLAISAITGAAPVPVPPPIPVVIKSIFAPLMALEMASRSSNAASRPTSGFAPAPKPRVKLAPNWILVAAWLLLNDWESVLALIYSTPQIGFSIILLMALQPPPPTPITLMTAAPVVASTRLETKFVMFYSSRYS